VLKKRKYKELKKLGLSDSEIESFLGYEIILKGAKKRKDKLEKMKRKGKQR
jgi:hypothetical protein